MSIGNVALACLNVLWPEDRNVKQGLSRPCRHFLRQTDPGLIRPESSLQKGLALLPSPPFFTQTWNNLFPDNAGSVTMSPS